MELVYLWVEKYKNIHKQGFNFSPRFHCNYDPDTNELTIDENDDYIENFFGDNINVTAIVGKNGSGKSSLLNLYIQAHDFFIDSIFSSDTDNVKKSISIFCTSENKMEIYTNIKELKYNNEFTKHIYPKTNTFPRDKNTKLMLYDNTFSILEVEERKFYIGSISNENKDIYKRNRDVRDILYRNALAVPNKIGNDIIRENEYQEKKNLLLYLRKNKDKNLNEVYEYFEPSSVYIYRKDEKENTELDTFSKFELFVMGEYLKSVANTSNLNNPLNINALYVWSLSPDCNITNRHKKNAIKTYLEYSSKISNGDKNKIFKIENAISAKLDLTQFDDTYIDWLMSLPECFRLSIKNKNDVDYAALSTGEKELLKIRFYIEEYLTNETVPFVILLDEPSNSLHPAWQKILIKFLVNTFEDRNIHFIITTHSPFLLSDIPKQNIIFLDTDEEGKCKVVDGLKEKKQTFGANIHTLLSDSFFMEDGLMGEFAKGKIDKAITLLNQEHLSDEELKYCEQIISIIGEPIVKHQLQRMLDSKRLKKIDEIDKLYDEIELIKHRIEIMRKNQ